MLQGNHPAPEICNDSAGRYPKEFKFTGWHPQCRCYMKSILKTDEEMDADNERITNGEELHCESVNSVDSVPDKFNQWLADNKERAKRWSSMPYFVRENPQYIAGFERDGAAFRLLNNQHRKGDLSEFNVAFSELLSHGLSKLKTGRSISLLGVSFPP